MNANGRARKESVSCLCFSKDRPLQLEGYVRSLQACSSEPPALSVLYKASSAAFAAAYAKLSAAFPDVRFIEESSFKADLEAWLETAAEIVLFGCDDVVFKEPFDMALARETFASCGERLAGFSLRLGLSLDFSVTTGKALSKPEFLMRSPILLWELEKGDIDWNYPFELDATLYRKGFVKELIEALRKQEAESPGRSWGHPNSFEGNAASLLLATKAAPPLMASFPSPKAVVVTVNRVQDVAKNQVFDSEGNLGPEKLLELWNAGVELDVEAYLGRSYRSIHVSEMLLRERSAPERKLAAGPPCDEIRDMVLACAEAKRKYNPREAAHPEFPCFLRDFYDYFQMPGAERAQGIKPMPLLGEMAAPSIDKALAHQCAWLFEKALKLKPARIVDLGSPAPLTALLAKLAPTESVDSRAMELKLPGLVGRKAALDALPYPDSSVEFLCALGSLERVGLGSYGEPLDPEGGVKALREAARVVAPGGRVVFSLPLSSEPFVCFNACRVMTRESVLAFFQGFELVDERLLRPEPVPLEALSSIKPFDFAICCFELKRE